MTAPAVVLCLSALAGCSETRSGGGNTPDAEPPPLYSTNDTAVANGRVEALRRVPTLMYADTYTIDALRDDTSPLWITADGVIPEADTLVSRLYGLEAEGLSPAAFCADSIKGMVAALRARAARGSTYAIPDSAAAELEAALTLALVRYAYGQRYGYVRPHKLFNRLLVDSDAANRDRTTYRMLYDIDCDVPDDSLARVALVALRGGRLTDFLRDVQPDSPLHLSLQAELRRATAAGDSARARLARINLERSRWRYDRPDTGCYVVVNLATQRLRAVNTAHDTCLEMRVCCGNSTHKSPLLISRISYMEFNPYWVVPQSIVRNEVVPHHVHDSSYFARNRMEAINNETQETVDPTSLSAEQWRSARYTLRQQRGQGNSLGRIVFRFPNKFSVYLHDTNQPYMFQRENRAVSHGCVRVEKPLELATFLLGPDASPLYIDKIRLSIDKPALTPQGQQLEMDEPLKRHTFSRPVPLWIDYLTLFPDDNGQMQESSDPYGYDKVIEEAMQGMTGAR